MALIDDVKLFLRVDSLDEDAQIQALIDSAEAYLTNAGIIADETKALYALAVKMLVNHWYENREPTGSASQIAFGLSSIITQLQNY